MKGKGERERMAMQIVQQIDVDVICTLKVFADASGAHIDITR